MMALPFFSVDGGIGWGRRKLGFEFFFIPSVSGLPALDWNAGKKNSFDNVEICIGSMPVHLFWSVHGWRVGAPHHPPTFVWWQDLPQNTCF